MKLNFPSTSKSIIIAAAFLLLCLTGNKLFAGNYPVNSYEYNNIRIQNETRRLTGLTAFTALQDNNVIAINWTTLTEVNTVSFTIEKSIDGINFEEVLVVEGA